MNLFVLLFSCYSEISTFRTSKGKKIVLKKWVLSLRNQGIITVIREGREINLILISQEGKKIEGLVLIRGDHKTLHGVASYFGIKI